MTKRIAIFYFWFSFVVSILAFVSNVGIGLFALGIFILTVVILHLIVGLKLNNAYNRSLFIIISATNLLLLSLLRIDGAHTITDNGLSALLDHVGIEWGYNRKYENAFFYSTFVLLVSQLVIDYYLNKSLKFDRVIALKK